eukprot:2992391-Lingulodinium_polyedra.AAC.1
MLRTAVCCTPRGSQQTAVRSIMLRTAVRMMLRTACATKRGPQRAQRTAVRSMQRTAVHGSLAANRGSQRTAVRCMLRTAVHVPIVHVEAMLQVARWFARIKHALDAMSSI